MERYDQELAFLLKYENIAWFDQGKVRILDRRIYPTRIEYVECLTYKDVIKAIQDMVTQSAGPYTAVGMGMALAAFEVRDQPTKDQMIYLENAAEEIANARITTANRYRQITNRCLFAAKEAFQRSENIVDAIIECTVESLNRRYKTMERVATYLVDKLPDDAKILTQCFGETIIGMTCRVATQKQKRISFFHAETRPFLQGARLTSSVCVEMGYESTLLTDNMVAYAMQNKGINVFTSAADTIARDGHIANKIGTFQIALLANHFGIPYFVTGIPDEDKKNGADIIIEERDPAQVLSFNGVKTTLPQVKAIYPSFDITPPHLISGVVTDKGVYSSYDLESYFDTEVVKFY